MRTEGLNIIKHRKGRMPHIVAVTAEPLPSRLASLARGTGEIDAVYHVCLPELKAGLEQLQVGIEDLHPSTRKARVGAWNDLRELLAGRQLRDISDLPFDLLP